MGEQEFLSQLNLNQGIIFKLVSLYAANEEEKKDLYQEIVLQAWKTFPNFRREAKFSTWLYRVSLNTILTQRRKANLIEYNDSIEHYTENVMVEMNMAPSFSSVKEAMRRLQETDRAIISMHLDGYENTEIAGVIGISNNHVAVKIHRIKQQLANLLKSE